MEVVLLASTETRGFAGVLRVRLEHEETPAQKEQVSCCYGDDGPCPSRRLDIQQSMPFLFTNVRDFQNINDPK